MIGILAYGNAVNETAGTDKRRSRRVDDQFRFYGIQFDITFTTRSGLFGSLVMRWTAKLCGPSMPSCIMKTLDSMIVLSPGLSTIEPMVNCGGQHPSTISM